MKFSFGQKVIDSKFNEFGNVIIYDPCHNVVTVEFKRKEKNLRRRYDLKGSAFKNIWLTEKRLVVVR